MELDQVFISIHCDASAAVHCFICDDSVGLQWNIAGTMK